MCVENLQRHPCTEDCPDGSVQKRNSWGEISEGGGGEADFFLTCGIGDASMSCVADRPTEAREEINFRLIRFLLKMPSPQFCQIESMT